MSVRTFIPAQVADTPALPRPAERAAIISFILVFLCGIALGAVVHMYFEHTSLAASHGTPPPAAGFTMSVTEWKQQLDLSPEQTVALTSVLDDFSRYYDDVLADGNSRIMQILNPQQREKFEQMLRDHKH